MLAKPGSDLHTPINGKTTRKSNFFRTYVVILLRDLYQEKDGAMLLVAQYTFKVNENLFEQSSFKSSCSLLQARFK